MLTVKASPGIRSRLAALLLSTGFLASTGYAGNPVTVQLYSGMPNPIYASAGTVTINYSYFLMYGGKGNPVGDNSDGVQANSLLVYNNSGDLLATLPIVGNPAFEREGAGAITWSNPVDQFIKLSGEIYSQGYGNNFFEWWYLPGRPSVASGGDTPSPPTGGVPTQPQPPRTTSVPPTGGQTNIHAVVISGLSDPAKVIVSPNVTLTGGLVALGKANATGGTLDLESRIAHLAGLRPAYGSQNSAGDAQHRRRAHHPATGPGRLSFAEEDPWGLIQAAQFR